MNQSNRNSLTNRAFLIAYSRGIFSFKIKNLYVRFLGCKHASMTTDLLENFTIFQGTETIFKSTMCSTGRLALQKTGMPLAALLAMESSLRPYRKFDSLIVQRGESLRSEIQPKQTPSKIYAYRLHDSIEQRGNPLARPS